MFDPALYGDFLAKKNTCPLFSCMWEPMINPSAEIIGCASADGFLSAEGVWPEHILAIAGRVTQTFSALKGDLPMTLQASGGIPWLEAICGCPVCARDGQIWATHPDSHSLDDFLRAPLHADWEEKLLQCHGAMIEFADGRFFAAVPVLHGPIDILSAFAGAETLSYAFYDEPETLKLALRKAGAVFRNTAGKLAEMLNPHLNGYCGRMYLYTKRPCATLQDDNSYLASPAAFKEFLEPVEREIIENLPCAVYHMHNSSLHLGQLVAGYGMAAIQMSVDPNGPAMELQLTVYEEMKRKTPLVLSCWSLDEMEFFRQKLSPQGLALTMIPAPDGCQINDSGAFDDLPTWQAAYENWMQNY